VTKTLQHTTDPQNWILFSPDGQVCITVSETGDGKLFHRVTRNEQSVFEDSPIGLSTSIADFHSELIFLSKSARTLYETYALVGGKKATSINHYNELTLRFKRKNREFHVVLRAYNDGIAYRYHVPGTGSISIYSEASAFRLPSKTEAWAQTFSLNYEEFYTHRRLSDMAHGDYGMPTLFKLADDRWVLLTEAAVYGDYCASHLRGGEEDESLLKVVFAPDQTNAVVAQRPFQTPWRAAIISPGLPGIVESDLIENLNPESEITDTSWIKPGRSAWSWWSGDSQSDYDVQVKYVDFASSMGWEYYLCDSGWNIEWLPEIVQYAKSKNVGIFVWAHHHELMTDDDIEDKLSRWASLGVKGVKVDYFDSDCQEQIKLYDKLAVETAKRRLLLNYHGSTKPSGERRRWPHLVTREGVLGAEYYKWSPGPTAEHNCTLPFTRNAVGPMDYTPVTYSNHQGQTTFAHQTALPIIFESNVQHLADRVSSFQDNAGEALELLKACPAVWDETKLLEGYPGRYVTIARRSENEWYVASICGGGKSHAISVALSFLPEGRFSAHAYSDGDTGTEVVHHTGSVTRETTLHLKLLVNGGCVVRLLPDV